ncbi:hypothetical protein [Longimicrobium sp.]|uniref:hypothetical protein n=1 Tax=Longimicrobium sp. TaxID=2029185 RepID=UPI002BF0B531|nr:hypothetical protein [Longimicrobium sp.]HSU12770.1 hypothetical protein [Longimicrobium sp.]
MRIPLKGILGAALLAAGAACGSATGSDAPRAPAFVSSSLVGKWHLTYSDTQTCPNSNLTTTTAFTVDATLGTPTSRDSDAWGKEYDYPINDATGTGRIGYCDGSATALVQPSTTAQVIMVGDSAWVHVAVHLHGRTSSRGEYDYGDVMFNMYTHEAAPTNISLQQGGYTVSMVKQ